MASASQITAITGGAALLIAAAVGGTYVAMRPPSARPAPPPAAAPPPPAASAPQAPPATLPDAGAAATDLPPTPQTVDFTPAPGQFTVIRPTPVYVGASTDAPQMYTLPAGIGVQTTLQSKDDAWVVAVTGDGQAAYLRTADLGPYQPNAMPPPDPSSQPIAGVAIVADTATLTVNGQRVPLFGITGETGVLADNLQDLITANGGSVTCQPQDQSFICLLPNGTDVGRAALYNGAASPNADASPDYIAQSDAAKQAHRGLWR